MKGPLVIPAVCRASLPEDLDKEDLVAELKLDGSRYILYIGNCDPYERSFNALLSRRVSTVDHMHVDRCENVPHITGHNYETLDGTVLDGEVFIEISKLL